MTIPCSLAWTPTLGFVSSRMVGGGALGVYGIGEGLDSILGRFGAGPGEFGRDLRVLTDTDGLTVIDNGNLRAARLSPGGDWLSSFRLPFRALGHALSGQDIALHTPPSALETDESPVALVDSTGVVGTLGQFDPTIGPLDQRVVSGVPDSDDVIEGGIWTYEVRRHSRSGEVLWRLRRDGAWVPGTVPTAEALAAMHIETPPSPVLTQLWSDPAGRLWTLLMVPDTEWRPGTPQPRSARWVNETFDSLIEVIDPTSGDLIVSHRVDTVLSRACGADYLLAVVETEMGDTRGVIFRTALALDE